MSVNNADGPAFFDLPGEGQYRGALSGREIAAEDGCLRFEVPPCGGEIWIPQTGQRQQYEPLPVSAAAMPQSRRENAAPAAEPRAPEGKPYEQMSVEELQAEILAKMARNGPVTDRMPRDVLENVYLNSLLNWVKSFR